jgi:hypothetical protein
MDIRCLADPNTYPDDDVLQQHLGKTKMIWDAFLDVIKNDNPLLSLEWRYYNDGKSWLGKLTKKKKTVCWIGIYDGYFQTTFYFTGKADDAIAQSPLHKTLKAQWAGNDAIGKIKPLTVKVTKAADIRSIAALIDLKALIK